MAKILTTFQPEFIDIIKLLAADGHEIYTSHPQFATQLGNLDIQAQPVAASVTPQIQQMALTQAADILCRTRPPKSGLGPAAMEFMNKGLKGFLYPRLADLVSFIITIDQLKPDLILVHNDVESLTRAMSYWGVAHQVPVIHIPHAVYLDVEKGEPGNDIHDIVTANIIACAGWFQAEWYKRRGAKQLANTGIPKFDPLARMDRGRPDIARQQLGLSKNRPVVTYCSSWRQDTNLLGCHSGIEETYLAILQVIKAMPHVQFIIKLHPRAQQNHEWHVNQAKEAEVDCTITAAHLETCLKASDLVLCYSGSNVLLEASFYPWIRLACTQGYETDGEVHRINADPPNSEKMTEAIERILQINPPNYSSFQAKYIGRPDGMASQRIYQLIRHLLNGTRNQISPNGQARPKGAGQAVPENLQPVSEQQNQEAG